MSNNISLQQQQQQVVNNLNLQHQISNNNSLLPIVSNCNSLQQQQQHLNNNCNNTSIQQQIALNNSLQQQLSNSNAALQQQLSNAVLQHAANSPNNIQQQQQLTAIGSSNNTLQLHHQLPNDVSGKVVSAVPGMNCVAPSGVQWTTNLSQCSPVTPSQQQQMVTAVSGVPPNTIYSLPMTNQLPIVPNDISNTSNNLIMNNSNLSSNSTSIINTIPMLNCSSLPNAATFLSNPTPDATSSTMFQSNTVVSSTIINTTIVNTNIIPVTDETHCLTPTVETMLTAPYIPRLLDTTIKDGSKMQPKMWTAQDVSTFLERNDCATYAANFSREVSNLSYPRANYFVLNIEQPLAFLIQVKLLKHSDKYKFSLQLSSHMRLLPLRTSTEAAC